MARLAINVQPLGRIVAGDRFYFIPAMSCGRDHSLSIQKKASNDASSGRLRPVGRGIWSSWPLRPAHRQFVRHFARQFFGARRFARLAHWGRYFRPRTAWRRLGRRFGGISRRCRGDFRRLNWHCVHRESNSTLRVHPAGSAITAGMKRCSRSWRHGTCDIRSRDRVRVMFLTATCCCGSCQPRHSPAIACRRCNRPAIRCATDVRSPPRAARATAALA